MHIFMVTLTFFLGMNIPSDDEDDGFDDEEDDDDDPATALMQVEFKEHKRDYYFSKLQYSIVTPEVLRDQAEGYITAIQWNLHYYYNGCKSWSWYIGILLQIQQYL